MVASITTLMHVFLLGPDFRTLGGFELQLSELAIGLHQKGVEVSVFIRESVSKKHPYWLKMHASGIKLYAPPVWLNRTLDPPIRLRHMFWRVMRRITFGRFREWIKKRIYFDALTWWMERRMDALSLKRPPDVIDVQHSMLPSGILYGRSRRIATIYTEYGAPSEEFADIWSGLTPVIHHADFMIGRARASIEGLRKICGADRPCDVVVNAVSGAPVESSECVLPADRVPVILVLGRLSIEKGPYFLLEAFRLMMEEGISAQLIFAGEGALRQKLEQRARKLNLIDRIQFVGSFEHVSTLMRKARIVAHPTLNDGRSVAVLEAMAWGRPVVGSNTGGLSELIDDGVTGLLVPPANSAALARALKELVLDPEKCSRMGTLARSKFLQGEFTVQNMTRRTLHIYTQVARDFRKRIDELER